MLRQCCMKTRKGKSCPINADRCHAGEWYCHVHDPEGVFARQSRGESVPGRTTVPANSKRVRNKRARRKQFYSLWKQSQVDSQHTALDREMDERIC